MEVRAMGNNGPEQMKDYVVAVNAQEWFDGERYDSQATFRVAGTSKGAALDGLKHGLKQIQGIKEVQILDCHRDHGNSGDD